MALIFPALDPVAFSVGPVAVRWYALAYIAGLFLGRWLAMRLAAQLKGPVTPAHVDSFLLWAVLGVIVGGRLGHVVLYAPGHYLNNPLEILMVWRGGMSFHGGLAGVTVAGWWHARRHGLPPLALADILSAVAPLGLFFGRTANFINQELWGRATDAPWGIVFPLAGPTPRHPSQLYEAALEGLLLFALLWWLAHGTAAARRPGLLTGMFLTGYAVARSVAEVFRAPTALTETLPAWLTWGQALSLPVAVAGLWLMARAWRGKPR